MSASIRAKRIAHMQAVRDRFQRHFADERPIARMLRVSMLNLRHDVAGGGDVTLAACAPREEGEKVMAWTWGRP